MVHLYTLFMVTPIFNTLMRIDKSLVEAARDAGASSWQVLWNVIIPLAKPGMAIGTIFVVNAGHGGFFHRAGHVRRTECLCCPDDEEPDVAPAISGRCRKRPSSFSPSFS